MQYPSNEKKKTQTKAILSARLLYSNVIIETVVRWSGSRKGRRGTEKIFILTIFTVSTYCIKRALQCCHTNVTSGAARSGLT